MNDSSPASFFSPDYKTARKLFQDAAKKAGGTLSQLPSVSEPGGDELVTDIAWFGSEQPAKAIVVVSGIHGVEGFAGSAIQLATLSQLPEFTENMALVMIHVLNPYGMANLRRFNGNNVDLNRNFHFSEDGWKGEPKGYAVLDPFLNPPKPPSLDLFHLKLLMAQIGLGERAIKQSIAAGQYRYPKGLFYGGDGLEPEAVDYIAWFKDTSLVNTDKLMVIDLHTGLGGFGEQSIFLRSESISREDLSTQLGIQIAPDKKESKVMGYDHGGGSSGVYRQLFTGEELICLTVEYGTYSGRRLLYALRAENQLYHYGNNLQDHWAKQKIKEAFSPKHNSWCNQVVSQGLALILKAAHQI
jgi:predicted deacylase